MGIGTAQGPPDPGVPRQIGLARNPFDVHLDTFRVVVLHIARAIGWFCRSVCVRNMSLEKVLVTVGLVTVFVGTREIALVEVRDVVMRCKRLFLFKSRPLGSDNGIEGREIPI